MLRLAFDRVSLPASTSPDHLRNPCHCCSSCDYDKSVPHVTKLLTQHPCSQKAPVTEPSSFPCPRLDLCSADQVGQRTSCSSHPMARHSRPAPNLSSTGFMEDPVQPQRPRDRGPLFLFGDVLDGSMQPISNPTAVQPSVRLRFMKKGGVPTMLLATVPP